MTTSALKVLMIQTQAENAGAQEIARLIGAGLRKRRFDVHQLFFYRATAGQDAMPNTRFCAMSRPRGPVALARFLVRLFVEIRRSRPDVVLTFQHYGNFFGAPVARLAGVPVVIANQNSAPEVIGRVLRVADRLAGSFGLYDANVTNSHETGRIFAAYPEAYRRRLVLIPHGFENKTSAIGKTAARERHRLPQGVPLLGTVARLNAGKQIDAAVRVLTRLPGVHLASAGQGSERDALLALARELGVADRFHLVGELDPSEIGNFLAGLDCFLFPTRFETFGLAGVEAAQTGVPVVANDLPVLREVLAVDGDPAALFVDVTDTDAFAEAIRRVLEDAPFAARLSAAGRGLERRYSLDAMVDAYAHLIESRVTRGVAQPRGGAGARTA